MYIDFPNIDPVAFSVGPLSIKWYGIAYSASLFMGWWYCEWMRRTYQYAQLPANVFEQLISWVVLAIILGGRLGYVIFYQPDYYLAHPLEILAVWQGGMAFHGALAACVISVYIYTRKHKIPFFQLTDVLTAAVPIGLFLGRLANFVNDELYGRVSTVPWAIKFPNGGFIPRHPSQLYEAFAEGILLFVLLHCLMRQPKIRQNSGTVSGMFLVGYGIARFIIEFFREPTTDSWGWVTMGHVLSVPMIVAGLVILDRRRFFRAN
jgi:phosphatidylglycerol:prolipoprotein diacylglycerol transferase